MIDKIEIEILVLCAICIFLLVLNAIQTWQSSKREKELFDRLLLSNEDYLANRVRTAIKPKKSIFLGKVKEPKPEDIEYPVD